MRILHNVANFTSYIQWNPIHSKWLKMSTLFLLDRNSSVFEELKRQWKCTASTVDSFVLCGVYTWGFHCITKSSMQKEKSNKQTKTTKRGWGVGVGKPLVQFMCGDIKYTEKHTSNQDFIVAMKTKIVPCNSSFREYYFHILESDQ